MRNPTIPTKRQAKRLPTKQGSDLRATKKKKKKNAKLSTNQKNKVEIRITQGCKSDKTTY